TRLPLPFTPPNRQRNRTSRKSLRPHINQHPLIHPLNLLLPRNFSTHQKRSHKLIRPTQILRHLSMRRHSSRKISIPHRLLNLLTTCLLQKTQKHRSHAQHPTSRRKTAPSRRIRLTNPTTHLFHRCTIGNRQIRLREPDNPIRPRDPYKLPQCTGPPFHWQQP